MADETYQKIKDITDTIFIKQGEVTKELLDQNPAVYGLNLTSIKGVDVVLELEEAMVDEVEIEYGNIWKQVEPKLEVRSTSYNQLVGYIDETVRKEMAVLNK